MEKQKKNIETDSEWTKITGPTNLDLFQTHKTRQTVLVGPYLLFFFFSTSKILCFNIETSIWSSSTPSGNSGLLDSSGTRNPICVVNETEIVVFGGSLHFFGQSMYLDTLTIDHKYGLDLKWQSKDVKETAPFRLFHIAELYKNNLYIFGGRDHTGQLTNELVIFSLEKHTTSSVPFKDPKPCERYDHSSLIHKDKMYIFGGAVAETVFLNDLWVLNLRTLQWECLIKDKDAFSTKMPDPRCLSLMQGIGNELFIFKGKKKQGACEDMFSYSLESAQWSSYTESYNIPFTGPAHTFVIHDKSFIIGKEIELYKRKDIKLFEASMTASEINTERYIKVAQKNIDNSSEEILTQYKRMFEDKLFSDIVFKVEGQEIHAHKVILAGRCNHFKNALTSGMMESHGKVIEIPNVKAAVFKALLEFIYCDEAPITEETAFDLFKLSDEYSLRNLRAKCELFMINHLHVNSVVDVVNHADLVEANNLRKAALKFIGKNIEVINAKDDIRRINKSILVDLIKK